MSAWIVNPRHIDYLVEAIREFGLTNVMHDRAGDEVPIGEWSNTELGQELMWENIRSVSERYPYDTFQSLPGPTKKTRMAHYTYRPSGLTLNPLAVLKALSCYDYQSCEHGYWTHSLSHAITKQLEELVVATLPEALKERVPSRWRDDGSVYAYTQHRDYDAMPWGIDPGTDIPAFDASTYTRSRRIPEGAVDIMSL